MLLELDNVFYRSLSGLSVRMPGPRLAIHASSLEQAQDLIALVTGRVKPRRGSCRTLGSPAFATPDVRRRLGTLLPEEALDLPGNVTSVFGLATAAGGNAKHPELLEQGLQQFDLLDWQSRPLAGLAPHDRRTLALIAALAKPSTELLILFEPFDTALPPSKLVELLREREQAGQGVLMVTTRLSELRLWRAQTLLLDEGQIRRHVSIPVAPELTPGQPLTFVIDTPDARKVAARLLARPWVAEVHAQPSAVRVTLKRAPETLTPAGEADELDPSERRCLELLALLESSDCPIRSLEMPLPNREALTAATLGIGQAAHDAAYQARLVVERARRGMPADAGSFEQNLPPIAGHDEGAS